MRLFFPLRCNMNYYGFIPCAHRKALKSRTDGECFAQQMWGYKWWKISPPQDSLADECDGMCSTLHSTHFFRLHFTVRPRLPVQRFWTQKNHCISEQMIVVCSASPNGKLWLVWCVLCVNHTQPNRHIVCDFLFVGIHLGNFRCRFFSLSFFGNKSNDAVSLVVVLFHASAFFVFHFHRFSFICVFLLPSEWKSCLCNFIKQINTISNKSTTVLILQFSLASLISPASRFVHARVRVCAANITTRCGRSNESTAQNKMHFTLTMKNVCVPGDGSVSERMIHKQKQKLGECSRRC